MKVVVRAADFAMTESVTDGCLKAVRDGILTDVGLMTNNYAYAKRAVEELKKYPHVSIGQDLNLSSGLAASDPKDIPSLVDENGYFLSSAVRREKNLYATPYIEVYKEMKLQIDRFIELVGRKPSYVIGHSLMTPEIEKAMLDLCKEYDLVYNIFEQPDFQVAKRWYYKHTSFRDEAKKEQVSNERPKYDIVAQAKTDVVDHILSGELEFDFENREYGLLPTHCGYCDKELMNMSSFSMIRACELEALCSPLVKQWISDNKIELINFDQFLEEHK